MNILKHFIKSIITEKVDKESSFMVALYPTQETIDNIVKFREQLNIPPGAKIHGPEELHNTVRFFEYNEEKVPELIEKLKKYTMSKPIVAKPKNIQKLGGSLSLMLDSPGAQFVFKHIDNDMKEIRLPPSDYPNYLVHMAFFYSEDEIEEPEGLMFENDIIFDSIKLVNQDDKVLWQLKCD